MPPSLVEEPPPSTDGDCAIAAGVLVTLPDGSRMHGASGDTPLAAVTARAATQLEEWMCVRYVLDGAEVSWERMPSHASLRDAGARPGSELNALPFLVAGGPFFRSAKVAPGTAAETSSPADSLTVEAPPAEAAETLLQRDVHRILTRLDDRLVTVLCEGWIRVLRSTWLTAQPDDYKLQSRQELEALEATGVTPSPLLSPKEAEAVVRRGDRSLGALTYPWAAATHPDPTGSRFRMLRKALLIHDYIEALFLDQSSLYQHPRGGRRTPEQEKSFVRALDLMPDMYASAIATTVLQLKEVPPRPKEFDGQLALFGLVEDVNEEMIRNTFGKHGTIVKVELVGGWPPAVVYFDSHKSALKAADAGALAVCKGQSTLYSELPYDKKGWCVHTAPLS